MLNEKNASRLKSFDVIDKSGMRMLKTRENVNIFKRE